MARKQRVALSTSQSKVLRKSQSRLRDCGVGFSEMLAHGVVGSHRRAFIVSGTTSCCLTQPLDEALQGGPSYVEIIPPTFCNKPLATVMSTFDGSFAATRWAHEKRQVSTVLQGCSNCGLRKRDTCYSVESFCVNTRR